MTPAGMIVPPGWMTEPAARRVLGVLGSSGRPARFVGGSVRDAVLARPVVDVDIATPLPPDAAARLLEGDGIRVIPTGIAHGTVTAVTASRSLEVTTLRRDVATYGRHATVASTDDWSVDPASRDFT